MRCASGVALPLNEWTQVTLSVDQGLATVYIDGVKKCTANGVVDLFSNNVGVFGLVQGAGGVYRVKVGDYLGRNHGRIVSVTESKIDVVEIVPDGEGGWLERPRSLALRERS